MRKGMSLRMAVSGTRCIGVDPNPILDRELPDTRIFTLTSDEFFARHDLRDLLGGPVALAFIDGLHLFEQVLRDFINVERHAGSRDRAPPARLPALRRDHVEPGADDRLLQRRRLEGGAGARRRTGPSSRWRRFATAPDRACTGPWPRPREPRCWSRSCRRSCEPTATWTSTTTSAHRDEMPPEIPNERGGGRATGCASRARNRLVVAELAELRRRGSRSTASLLLRAQVLPPGARCRGAVELAGARGSGAARRRAGRTRAATGPVRADARAIRRARRGDAPDRRSRSS